MSIKGQNLMEPEPTLLPAEPEVDMAVAAGWSPREIAAGHPRSSLAWALAARESFIAGDHVAAYAFARVGYHRGLDALRAAGWRGAGPIPWVYAPNRGFWWALYWLRRAAQVIGELDEIQRIADFMEQSDPTALDAIEAALLAETES